MKAILIGLLLASSLGFAQAPLPAVALPAPHRTGGRPVMEALALRATSRAFSPAELPAQELSDLLWAAFGINRADGRRTAPSAKNWQETDIFVLLKSGAYRYDAKANSLVPVVAGDIRERGGIQPFVREAPVTLVYVADLSKTGSGPLEPRREMSAMDTAFIAANACIYCASEGLATGVRAYVDKAALGAKLGLGKDQVILLAQSVGWPAASQP